MREIYEKCAPRFPEGDVHRNQHLVGRAKLPYITGCAVDVTPVHGPRQSVGIAVLRVAVSLICVLWLVAAAFVPWGSPALAEGSDPAVLEIQTILKKHGFDPGPLDGKPGPKTRRTAAAFQMERGLLPTGVTDAALLARLRVWDRPPPPPAPPPRAMAELQRAPAIAVRAIDAPPRGYVSGRVGSAIVAASRIPAARTSGSISIKPPDSLLLGLPAVLVLVAAVCVPVVLRRRAGVVATTPPVFDTVVEEKRSEAWAESRRCTAPEPAPSGKAAFDAWCAGGAVSAPAHPRFPTRYLADLEGRFFRESGETERDAIVTEVKRLRANYGDNIAFAAEADRFLTVAYVDIVMR